MSTVEIVLSWVGAVLTSITLIPQAYKILKTKETAAISIYMMIIFMLSATVWFIFAVMTEQWAITATNGLVFIFALMIFSFKVYNIKTKKEQW